MLCTLFAAPADPLSSSIYSSHHFRKRDVHSLKKRSHRIAARVSLKKGAQMLFMQFSPPTKPHRRCFHARAKKQTSSRLRKKRITAARGIFPLDSTRASASTGLPAKNERKAKRIESKRNRAHSRINKAKKMARSRAESSRGRASARGRARGRR